MLFSLNVGKVDAGVAVLLTEDMRVIEFPSILLPEGIKSGSIVDISVGRNHAAEAAKEKSFRSLQNSIWETYGKHTPQAPVLRCRNVTQTAVVLEWDPLELATAKLRSLAIYRNGEKMGNIPDPLHNTSTKISGLAIDREYTFQLELRTSSGMYKSKLLKLHTHKMTELSGITVTPGVLPAPLRESLEIAVKRIGGKLVEGVRLDTTHFVCTEGRGRDWERAREMNIPVVRPEWVEGCEREGRMVGVKDYYLDANPKMRQIGPGPGSRGSAAGGGGGPTPETRPSQAPTPATQNQTSLPSRHAVSSPSQEVPGVAAALHSPVSNEGEHEGDVSPISSPEPQHKDHSDEEDKAKDDDYHRADTPTQQKDGRQHDEDEDSDVGNAANFEEVAL